MYYSIYDSPSKGGQLIDRLASNRFILVWSLQLSSNGHRRRGTEGDALMPEEYVGASDAHACPVSHERVSLTVHRESRRMALAERMASTTV